MAWYSRSGLLRFNFIIIPTGVAMNIDLGLKRC